MTKREESKSEYSKLLREDVAKARKCKKGKPCGGRCLPAHWNCRLKGEGDTPPTRGGLVQRTPELQNKLNRFKRQRRNKALLGGLTGLAALAGGATAGAAFTKRGENPGDISKAASTFGGIASALNPAFTIPASLGAMGAAMGAYGMQGRLQSKERKAQRLRLIGISSRKKGIDTRIKKKEAERAIYENDVDKANRIIQGVKTKTNKTGKYSDRERRVAFAKLKVATNRLTTIDGQLTGLLNRSKKLGLEYLNQSKGLSDRATAIQSTMNVINRGNDAARRTRSQRLAARRNTGLTGQGTPGAKRNPVPWNLQNQNLENRSRGDAAATKGQKCGGSYISPTKKCRKGVSGSVAGAVVATAAVGFLGFAGAKAVDDVVRVRSRQFGEPNFRAFKGAIGDANKYIDANGKKLAAGAFGSTKIVSMGGKNYVVKTPKTPDKNTRKMMSVGLDAKATRNLYRAQGRLTNSEVANTRLAASLGLAPKVVAANSKGLVSEVAKGKPATSLNDAQAKELHSNLSKLHRAGIAHNDLKADNFFVDKSNKIQFIDFGLSQRSSTGVAREWYRAMNPPSRNPLLKATGTATGSFNLRRFNDSGYKAAESAMKKVLKGEVSEDNIIKAGRDPKTARQLQVVVNNYYLGKYNKVRKDDQRSDVVFTNKELHARVKAEAKRKFKVYPSAYANAWMVKEYKKRGGGFRNDDLNKWFQEKWVRMSAKGEILGECGDRSKGEGKPRCLPEAKARALSKKERASTVRAKRKSDPKKNRSGKAKMVPNTFDEEGKKYSKTVTNPETGRKKTVKYGAKGYRIAPGTNKGDRYCARSFGDMKSHNKNCAGKDRNTPLCLSRAKWKCSGKSSRRS